MLFCPWTSNFEVTHVAPCGVAALPLLGPAVRGLRGDEGSVSFLPSAPTVSFSYPVSQCECYPDCNSLSIYIFIIMQVLSHLSEMVNPLLVLCLLFCLYVFSKIVLELVIGLLLSFTLTSHLIYFSRRSDTLCSTGFVLCKPPVRTRCPSPLARCWPPGSSLHLSPAGLPVSCVLGPPLSPLSPLPGLTPDVPGESSQGWWMDFSVSVWQCLYVSLAFDWWLDCGSLHGNYSWSGWGITARSL